MLHSTFDALGSFSNCQMKIENTTYHKEIAYKVLSLPPVSEAIVEEENVFVHRCPVPLAF